MRFMKSAISARWHRSGFAIDPGEHRQVGLDAEVLLVFGCEHDHPRCGVFAELGESRRELRHQVLGDAVVAFSMHDHARDRAIALDVDANAQSRK